MTSAALRFYSLGMLAFGLREVLSRAFYALQDTRTPMVNGAIAVVINIVLNLILSRYLGIGGLALATSFSGLVATLLLFVTLREKIGGFGMKTVFSSFCKILSCVTCNGRNCTESLSLRWSNNDEQGPNSCHWNRRCSLLYSCLLVAGSGKWSAHWWPCTTSIEAKTRETGAE